MPLDGSGNILYNKCGKLNMLSATDGKAFKPAESTA